MNSEVVTKWVLVPTTYSPPRAEMYSDFVFRTGWWAENGHKAGSESVRSPHACQTRNDTWRHPKIEGGCVLNAYWYAKHSVSNGPPGRAPESQRARSKQGQRIRPPAAGCD